MNRRGFLRTLVGGVAVGAAVRTWPFRVYSFPAEVGPEICADMDAVLQNYYKYSIAYYYNHPGGNWLGLSRSMYPGRLKVSNPQMRIPLTFRKGDAILLK